MYPSCYIVAIKRVYWDIFPDPSRSRARIHSPAKLFIVDFMDTIKNFRSLGRSMGSGGGRKKAYAAVNDI